MGSRKIVVMPLILLSFLLTAWWTPCVQAYVGDTIRINEACSLTEGQHVAYNLSCYGQRGYYGHVGSSNGDIAFSIVQTAFLAGFLSNVSSPETQWRGSSIDWEYPCPNPTNVSFVLQRESPGSTEASLVVLDDETPASVNLAAIRVALYLPIYQLNFTFYGRFFDYAFVRLPRENWSRWLDQNESLLWYAYAYDANLSAYISLPDGIFNVSVTVREESGRTTDYAVPIAKRSGQELAVVVSVFLLGVTASVVTEIFRRLCHRRKLAANVFVPG